MIYGLDSADRYNDDLVFPRINNIPNATVHSARNKLMRRQPELDAISERSTERLSGSFGPVPQQTTV